jgi:hypothetical protein
MAGVLCAALVGSACAGDAATGASSLVGPGAIAAEGGPSPVVPEASLTAQSGGLTPPERIERGWSCRRTPAGTTACSPPGRGLPVIGAPDDRPPSYLVHVFDTSTYAYLGFARMIRTDLYQGQICPSTGAPYGLLPHLGYYECFKLVS